MAVHILPAGADPTTAATEVERIWRQQPTPHLFLVTGREPVATADDPTKTSGSVLRTGGLGFSSAVCRKWFELMQAGGLLQGGTLVAATALGGDFGRGGHGMQLEGGGLAGLLKALHRKARGELTVKIIDGPPKEPAKMVATEILNEISAADGEIEIGYVRGGRRVVRANARPVDTLPKRAIEAGTVWVVVGFPAAPHAELARQLADRFGVRVHLVGPPLPHPEVFGSPQFHVCDPANRDELTRTLREIRRSDGPIQGVVLVVGSVAGDPWGGKPPGSQGRSMDDVLDGAAAVVELAHADSVRSLVALGTGCGHFGDAERVADSLVDEMIAKLLDYDGGRRPDCVTLSVRVTDQMAPAEWISHCLDEIQAHSMEPEVLITRHPGGPWSGEVQLPTAAQLQCVATRREMIDGAPIVDNVYFENPQQALAAVVFHPTSDPFLLSHLDDGVPLFPAVMGVEVFAEAARILSDGRQMAELVDFKLVNGLRMNLDRPYRAEVLVTLEGDRAGCRLQGEYYGKDGRLADPYRLYQAGTLRLADEQPALGPLNFGSPPSEWTDIIYPDDWQDRAGSVFYGPALRTLKSEAYDSTGGWGIVVAPELSELSGPRTGDRWCTAPAVLDAALFSCDLYLAHNLRSRQFPHSIEKLQFGRMPQAGEVCMTRLVYRGRVKRHFVFDFWVVGENDDALFVCTGCRFVDIDYSFNQALAGRR